MMRAAAAPGEQERLESARPGRRGIATVVALVALVTVLIAAADLDAARNPSLTADAALLDDNEVATRTSGGTWSDLFDPESFSNQVPILFWAAALVLVGLIGLPYVWLAASRLPDRGYALARPVGLLLVGWVVWLPASVGVASFSRATIGGAVGIVAAGALAIAVAKREELGAWLLGARRLLLVEEAVFWLLFGAAVFVRWSNPDLWHPTRGGEKPMDFAFLNAVIKSTEFPPYDPWFAGGAMNYYYFGFVLVAVLVKLTAIVPSIAYNLAVPTFFAFLGTAAFGVATALVPGRAGAPEAARRRPLLLAGALGALFVAVIGNLGELRVLADRIAGQVPVEWWYWNPSRVIAHPETEPGPITEFPAFTFLYADLHAHAMALPYTVVVLGLALGFVRRGPPVTSRAGVFLRFCLLGLVLGGLWPLNTWDFAAYAAVVLLVLLTGALPEPRRWRAALGAVGSWIVVVALGYLAFLPFHNRYVSSFEGFSLWQGTRTRLVDYLTIHGFFFFVIGAAALVDFLRATDLNAVARRLRLYLRRWNEIRRLRALEAALLRPSRRHRAGLVAILGGFLLALVLGILGEGVSAVVAGLATLLALLLARRPRRSGKRERADQPVLWRVTLVLALVGLLLTLAVEFVVVKNIDVGRVNTVFKTYLQVWVLLALASAAAFYALYERLPRLPRPWSVAWRLGFVCLFAITMLYPILATRAKIADRFDRSVGSTLDGTAFMRTAVLSDQGVEFALAPDREAIEWMLARVEGSPVVAEVNTSPTLYGWGNRYAMFTGNPSVVGWDYHERQQRPDASELVTERIAEIQRAYGSESAEEAHEILARHGVRYVVVGPLEKAYFPQGEGKWETGRGVLWDVVYDKGGVRIFELLSSGGPAPTEASE